MKYDNLASKSKSKRREKSKYYHLTNHIESDCEITHYACNVKNDYFYKVNIQMHNFFIHIRLLCKKLIEKKGKIKIAIIIKKLKSIKK